MDLLAQKLGVAFKKKTCQAQIAEAFIGGERVIIAKPQTYMNSSGQSVKELVGRFGAHPDDLIVAYDDYDLPVGSVRMRKSGSAGTHNGMRDIVFNLGWDCFKRVRVGIKPLTEVVPLIEYVLSDIPADSRVNDAIPIAADALERLVRGEDFDKVSLCHNIKG